MNDTASSNVPTDRRADLDWLRVVCILILLVYHVGMYFVPWDWHIKNPELLPALVPIMRVLHQVRMPLLMLIAGEAAAIALARRTGGQFAKDRARRLLGPLLFGIFVVVPPQIYIERVSRGAFHGGYLSFWPQVLQLVPYPSGGSLSWHHLWFVAYLCVYSWLAVGLDAWLRKPSGRAFLAAADGWLACGPNVTLLYLPLAAISLVFRNYPATYALFNDPKTLAYYGLLFAYCQIMGRCPSLGRHLVASRRRYAIGAFVLIAVMMAPGEYPSPLEQLGTCAAVWTSILAALGYARTHVVERKPWLARAQSLAYPFYILHQTVIIVAAYAMHSVAMGPWVRLLVLVVISFLVTWALCEGVSRVGVLRPCFGLGPRAARSKQMSPGRRMALS